MRGTAVTLPKCPVAGECPRAGDDETSTGASPKRLNWSLVHESASSLNLYVPACQDQDQTGGDCSQIRPDAIFLSRLQGASVINENFRQESPLEIRCPECGSEQFHRSHLRLKDLLMMLLLRYPMRCYSCFTRRYAPVGLAFSSGRKPVKRWNN